MYALIYMRLLAACIFAGGAIYLASKGQDGWGWCIFAALMLGCFSFSQTG